MTEQTETEAKKPPSLWQQIPEVWKAIGVILAIGGTAIGGYATLRDQRDALQQVDSGFDTRIKALEEARGQVPQDLSALETRLGNRIDSLGAAMIRAEDLDAYVINEALDRESCRLAMRAQMHEYRALETAYDELLESIRIAGEAFSNRTDLKAAEEQQRDRLITLQGNSRARNSTSSASFCASRSA